MIEEKAKEYRIACTEVLEIIDNISYDDYLKIPKDIIQNLEESRDENSDFTYDPSLTLDEQNVSEGAKAIIAVLYRDYLASQEQKEKIKNEEKEYYLKEEEKKKEKYNFDDLFNNINQNSTKEKIRQDFNHKDTEIKETNIVKRKENIFVRFKNFISKIFHFKS